MRFCLSVVFVLLAESAAAQVTLSTIRGTVSDQTGGVIANTQIALTEVDTNTLRSVTSNANGDFEIPDLRPGKYRLVATALVSRALLRRTSSWKEIRYAGSTWGWNWAQPLRRWQ